VAVKAKATITLVRVNDGVDGENGITYRIESSAGFIFDTNTETQIKALIYSGSEEIDLNGNLNYTWYARKSNDTDFSVLTTGKIATIFLTEDMQIYFVATPSEASYTRFKDELENRLTDELGNYLIE